MPRNLHIVCEGYAEKPFLEKFFGKLSYGRCEIHRKKGINEIRESMHACTSYFAVIDLDKIPQRKRDQDKSGKLTYFETFDPIVDLGFIKLLENNENNKYALAFLKGFENFMIKISAQLGLDLLEYGLIDKNIKDNNKKLKSLAKKTKVESIENNDNFLRWTGNVFNSDIEEVELIKQFLKKVYDSKNSKSD